MLKADKIYDRKVVYLDYLERGEKVKNSGFLKWESQGENSHVRIHIRGLYATDTLQGEILLVSRKDSFPVDKMGLKYGTGEYVTVWNNAALAGTAISYEECDGILIRISENRLIKGLWRDRSAEGDGEPSDFHEVVSQLPETREQEEQESVSCTEPLEEAGGRAEQESVSRTEPLEEAGGRAEQESVSCTEPLEEAGGQAEQESVSRTVSLEETEQHPKLKSPEKIEKVFGQPKIHKELEQESLSADKWEQLEKIYPRIHPFGDARECLSITPRDFVVLTGQYQGLVQNSFLLHGYYNYGHVVLVKIPEQGRESVYLGVPGVYFDREKQAALMFGFEGFEAGSEKVTEGGFGYYMKRVEI